MPLSAGKAAFKATMKAYLESVAANSDPEKTTTVDEYLDALADAIDAYMQTATILPTGLPTPMSNSGGPVVGTGLIT